MSETPQLTQAQLAAGRDKRRAKLFERHASGSRLAPKEREEISDLIEASEKAAHANDLKLEPAPAHAVRSRTGLIHKLPHYATLLEVGLRSVKRWLGDGVKAKDACPLDDLAKFPAWWNRVHPGRALDARVALAVERALQPPKTAPPEAAGAVGLPNDTNDGAPNTILPQNEAVKSPPKPLINLSDVAALTLDENRHSLQTIHAANMQLLVRAFGAGSLLEIDARQRTFERSQKMLIDTQNALDAHLKERGELIPREEIKRELLRLHSAMAQSLVGQLTQVGLSRDRATIFVDTWFRHLGQSRFAASTAPELRPTTTVAA